MAVGGGALGDAMRGAIRALMPPDLHAVDLCALRGDDALVASLGPRGESDPSLRRFLLYSITKTMAAVAALQLVGAGRLDLDDDLGAWLPEFAPAREFTLRHLLQHTSGLPDYGGSREYHEAVRAGGPPWTEDEFLDRTEASRLRSVPGRTFAYSNIGYMLLRRVLVRASGEGFADLLRRVVFGPPGLEDAALVTTPAELSGFTFGPSRYLGGDGEPADVIRRYHPGWIAPGVVGASPASAARFLHSLWAGTLLPVPLRDEMSKGRQVEIGDDSPWKRPAYGLGLMMEMDDDDGPAYGHLGGGPGCSPAVFHFPRKSRPLTVCVVTSGESTDRAVLMVKAVAATVPRS